MTIITDPLPIINTFLSKVGMSNQSFDENNAMPLSFDNILIGLHKDEAKKLLLVSSVIGTLTESNGTETATAEAYNKILEANLASTMVGAGSVGISRENGLIIYGNAISLIDLTQNSFEAFLERSVNIIEDWYVMAKQESAFTPANLQADPLETFLKI